ncbi:unnamed protein product [Spirodela intermedia]|uniref:Uncharacterized protein n=1 Tax=Spirodela intermedia TaxID=51605 RepID=A0A7I8L9N4_SPIIN|nr:unnamed protein product [Spirodela intermedia]
MYAERLRAGSPVCLYAVALELAGTAARGRMKNGIVQRHVPLDVRNDEVRSEVPGKVNIANGGVPPIGGTLLPKE